MKKFNKQKFQNRIVWLTLFLLLVVLPMYCYAQSPKYNVYQSIVHALPNIDANSMQEASFAHIAAISAFYQNVITILTILIGVLSVFAFVTVRHLSKIAAEDMAIEAAQKVVEDSRKFSENLDDRIQEVIADALKEVEALKKDMKIMSETIAKLNVQENDSSDQHVDEGQVSSVAEKQDPSLPIKPEDN